MGQPYIGEIRMFGGNFAPAGWARCDGQMMPIVENDTLFNLIGTTYGGDGQETFGLPNLQSRVPIHTGTGPGGTTYQLGEMAGTESVPLTTQQIPIHNHALIASQDAADESAPAGKVVAHPSLVTLYIENVPSDAMAANAVSAAGGSQPHENMQPFLCVNFIISLYGVFPTQT